MTAQHSNWVMRDRSWSTACDSRFIAQKAVEWYLVEDDSRAEFYRLGMAEYTFISMLDGRTTISTAVATTCALLGADAFSDSEAANLCRWLVDSGLAHTQASTSAKRAQQAQKNRRPSRTKTESIQFLSGSLCFMATN